MPIAILADGKPLAYGTAKEPYPELLAFRDRVDTFKNTKTAEDALTKSLTQEDKLGSKWHKGIQFRFANVMCTCR